MEFRTVITLNKDDDSNVESCCVTSDARHPRVCLIEAIGKLCRHGRIIYYSSKKNGKNGFVIVSKRINFHSFSFQIAVYLTLFLLLVFNKVFKTA